MNIHIHAHMHVPVHTHTHTCTQMDTYTCTHTCTCTPAHTQKHAHTHTVQSCDDRRTTPHITLNMENGRMAIYCYYCRLFSHQWFMLSMIPRVCGLQIQCRRRMMCASKLVLLSEVPIHMNASKLVLLSEVPIHMDADFLTLTGYKLACSHWGWGGGGGGLKL